MKNQLTFQAITEKLHAEGLLVDAAEIHGMLCGMLSGGMSLTDPNWLQVLSDTVNQSGTFSDTAQQLLSGLHDLTCQQLLEAEFSLELILPDDNYTINEQGLALINWVQGFLLGFGLYQQDLNKCSEDVKEALHDFADIARMEEPMNDDEESQRALFEVVEYIKISTLLCYSELGQSLLDDQADKPTVH